MPDPADVGAALRAVEFYWRPGCGFCALLDRELSRLGIPLDKYDIWEDEAAAAFVRSVAGGNETVPTVAIGSESRVNPSVEDVVALLRTHAPTLIPTDLR